MARSIRTRSLAAAVTLALAGFMLSATVAATPARATGWGIYLDYALGEIDLDDSIPFDTGRIGVGLSLDTAVAKDKLFNYRLNLGYEQVRWKFDGTDTELGRWNGGSFENIFGFGVYRTKLMRVWLGPSLRLASGVLDESSFILGPVPGKIVDLSAGGGLSAGINLHTGKIGSAAFTIGYQYAWHGQYRSQEFVGFPGYSGGTEQRVNFNFAYFFRGAGDQFE